MTLLVGYGGIGARETWVERADRGRIVPGNLGNPPVDIVNDTQPMTAFRTRSAEILKQLKETGRPVTLTVNGKAAAVVQDAAAYRRLLDLAAAANVAEGIRQGLEDLENGRTQPARAVFAALREKYGVTR